MPAIVTKPVGAAALVGQTAAFSVAATGTPFTVQWYRNGVALDGATSTSYTTPVLAAYDDGTRYAVAVSNESGTVFAGPVILSLGNTVWTPIVAEQPAGATLAVGQAATFRVSAYGTGALSYQWLLNGSPIAGATADTYTTPVQATATSGPGARYRVRVTNSGGNVLSDEASLSVTAAAAPGLASGPFSNSAFQGAFASFSATPSGTAPFTYQWRRNGVAIPGATSSTYLTAPTTAADNGANFSVVVTNAVGSVNSVDIPLSIVTQWSGIREDGSISNGASNFDDARAVTTDADGNVVIAGQVDGSFGNDNPGLVSQAYVAKYTRTGSVFWAHRSLAGPTALTASDVNRSVATDAAGNIYAVGSTYLLLPGQTKPGSSQDSDISIVKYAGDGSLLWMRQLGSAANEGGYGVAVDSNGNVSVAGQTLGALPGQPPSSGLIFIAKYDANGNRLWIRQTGGGIAPSGALEGARGIALDAAGNAYIGGYINAPFAGRTTQNSDAFAAKYDTNGNQVWFSRVLAGDPVLSSGPEEANAIAVSDDGSAVYLAGRTLSDFDTAGFPTQTTAASLNRPDAFVLRLNGNTGALQWARNLSSVPQTNQTYFTDEAFGIATNATGNAVFITGATLGQMPGDTSRGDQDIFVARYEGDGTRTWVRQFGAAEPAAGAARNDAGRAITIDRDGNLFVAGEVIGTFGTPGRLPNRTDWFVLKLRPADGSAF